MLNRLLIAALAAAPAAVWADTVTMQNGDRLSGRIVSFDGETLTLSGPYAEELALPWAEVERLESDEPLYLQTTDGRTLRGTLSTDSDGQVVLEQADNPELIRLAPTAVAGFGQQPPAPEETDSTATPLELSGAVNFGLSHAEGNTDTEAYFLDGSLTSRRDRHRIIFATEANYEEDNDVRTENEVIGSATYDYFVSPKWYLNNSLQLEHDEFEELDLRTTVGLGAGYQFADSATTKGSAEFGLGYVYNNYTEGESDDNPAARWAFNFETVVFAALTFFHEHEALINLDFVDGTLVDTRTGLRIPLTEHLNGALQLDIDYDGDPAPGAEYTDREVVVTLGYSF